MSTELQKRPVQWAPILLEVLPGWFQIFGVGHIYQGRLAMGLGIMFSYWLLQAINLALSWVLVGFLTGPLTWLFYMIAAPMNANDYDGGGSK